MRRMVLAGFVVIALATAGNAQEGFAGRVDALTQGPAILGGGVAVGEPTGLTVKYWWAETGFALDAAVAWSFVEEASLYMHAGALFHYRAFESSGGRFLMPYVGLGPVFRAREESALALRLPIGLSVFAFPHLPLELFGEVVPGFQLLPKTDLEFGAGLGVRLYFRA